MIAATTVAAMALMVPGQPDRAERLSAIVSHHMTADVIACRARVTG